MNTRLHQLLEKHPRLRPVLERVCQRLNQRGEPTGGLKLGEHLDRIQEVEPLKLLFGNAITVSAKGAVTLNFGRLAEAARDSATLESFLTSLYAATGIPRENRPAQRLEREQTTRTMLLRLRQQFPSFASLHDRLASRESYWQRRVAQEGLPAVQGLLEGAFRIVNYLSTAREPMTFSDLGARVLGDSKILRGGEMQTIAGDFLAQIDTPEAESDVETRAEVWRRRNVVNNPSAIKVTLFGPLVYWKRGQEFDWIYRLWKGGETATLSQGNLAGIERCELHPETIVFKPPLITCENESPFCRLAQQREPGIFVYTEGYPNAAVLELLHLLRPLQLSARHWGDSDLDGLRIAEILNHVHPLTLWRCHLAELQRLQSRLKPLTAKQQETATNFLQNHPAFPFATELAYTIGNGWLEQESWTESMPAWVLPPG